MSNEYYCLLNQRRTTPGAYQFTLGCILTATEREGFPACVTQSGREPSSGHKNGQAENYFMLSIYIYL